MGEFALLVLPVLLGLTCCSDPEYLWIMSGLMAGMAAVLFWRIHTKGRVDQGRFEKEKISTVSFHHRLRLFCHRLFRHGFQNLCPMPGALSTFLDQLPFLHADHHSHLHPGRRLPRLSQKARKELTTTKVW